MKLACTVLIAASLLIAGCSSPEDKFVGTYAGSIEFPPEMLEKVKSLAAMSGQDPEEALAEISSLNITLDLKPDGVFTATTTAGGEQSTTDGKWTLSEDEKTVTLRDIKVPEDAKEQAANLGLDGSSKDQVYSVSEDGKSLTYTETEMGLSATVTFTRK